MMMDPRVTKNLTHGVYLVGTKVGEKRNLMTLAWLMQSSSSPLMISLAVSARHLTTELLRKSDFFSVSILRPAQKNIAKKCGTISGRTADKTASLALEDGPEGLPILKNAAGWLVCRKTAEVPCGDHIVFMAEVIDSAVQGDDAMVYRS